jgi:hypothetical protein
VFIARFSVLIVLVFATIAFYIQRGLTGSDQPQQLVDGDILPAGYSEVGFPDAAEIKGRTVYARTLSGHGFDGKHAASKVVTIAVADRMIRADRRHFQQMLAAGGGSQIKSKDGKLIGVMHGSDIVYLGKEMDSSLIMNHLDNSRRNARNNPPAFNTQLMQRAVVVIPRGEALEVVDAELAFLKVKYHDELWWVAAQSVYRKSNPEQALGTAK